MILDNLMLIAGLGKQAYGRWRLRHISDILTRVLILGLVAVALVVALAIGSIYALYQGLLYYGVDMPLALPISALPVLVLILAVIASIRQYIRKLKAEVGLPVREVTDAFFDGLFS